MLKGGWDLQVGSTAHPDITGLPPWLAGQEIKSESGRRGVGQGPSPAAVAAGAVVAAQTPWARKAPPGRLRDGDPGDFSRTKSLPTIRTGCLCSSSAPLPAAPILQRIPFAHTHKFFVALPDAFGYSNSLAKFLTYSSGFPNQSLHPQVARRPAE